MKKIGVKGIDLAVSASEVFGEGRYGIPHYDGKIFPDPPELSLKDIVSMIEFFRTPADNSEKRE